MKSYVIRLASLISLSVSVKTVKNLKIQHNRVKANSLCYTKTKVGKTQNEMLLRKTSFI